jgi:hypothetical protein
MEDFDNIKLMSRRPNIATLSGLRFDYAEPTVGMVNIFDIAAGTSKCCRFAGQCRGWYSVARHQVLVSERVERLLREQGFDELTVVIVALAALLHDAAEAYTNDAPSPWKKLLRDLWRPLETRMMRVIFTAFGIDIPIGLGVDPVPKIVHEADEFMYLCEWHDIMNTERIKDWYYPGERPSYEEQPRIDNSRTWQDDHDLFLRRYDALVARRQTLRCA